MKINAQLDLNDQTRAILFESFDQSLTDLGGFSRNAILDELQLVDLAYDPAKFEFRRVYNQLKLKLGQSSSNLIIALVYQKLCSRLQIPPNSIPIKIENYDRVMELLDSYQRSNLSQIQSRN